MESAFFVHPLPDHLAKHSGLHGGSRPHLIYRRSVSPYKEYCQVKGKTFSAHPFMLNLGKG